MPEGGSGYLWLHERAGGVVQRYVRPRTARQEHQDKSGRVWKHARLEERRSCCFVLPTKWLLPPNNRRLDSRRVESGGRLPTLSFVLVGSDVLRGSGRCPLPSITRMRRMRPPDAQLRGSGTAVRSYDRTSKYDPSTSTAVQSQCAVLLST